MMRCSRCGIEVRHYFLCGKDPGCTRCPHCFNMHPCRVEPHEKNCETEVWDDDES